MIRDPPHIRSAYRALSLADNWAASVVEDDKNAVLQYSAAIRTHLLEVEGYFLEREPDE